MENTNNKNDILKPAIILFAIAVIVVAILSVINIFTAPIIENASDKAVFGASFEVLPDADSFEIVEGINREINGVTIKHVYKAKNGTGSTATVTVKGYGTPMDIVVGVDSSGTITGVKVLDNNETQGIGSKVVDPKNTLKFVGKKDDNAVDVIAEATITSTAVNNAVKVAYDTLTAIK